LTPAYNLPGVYFPGKCGFWSHFTSGNNFLKFCIDRVTITSDLRMKFDITWTAHIPGIIHIDPEPPTGPFIAANTDSIFLTDQLGNRYNYIQTNAFYIYVSNADQSFSYWFIFPPAKEGAIQFTFHQFDPFNKESDTITGIVLRSFGG